MFSTKYFIFKSILELYKKICLYILYLYSCSIALIIHYFLAVFLSIYYLLMYSLYRFQDKYCKI